MLKPILLTTLILLALFKFNFGPIFTRNSRKPQTEIHVIIKNAQIARSHCEGTSHPALCVSTVDALPDLRCQTLRDVIRAIVNVTVREVRATAHTCTKIRRKRKMKPNSIEERAIEDCLDLFSVTVAQLSAILADLSPTNSTEDVQTLLSGAMTNQYTCLDGFAYSANNYTRHLIEGRVSRTTRRISNALALIRKLSKKKPVAAETSEFPAWLEGTDPALLGAASRWRKRKANLVVAKDGSGHFRTINAALAAAPNNSNSTYVIHIKRGSYYEYIEVESPKTNIMFRGAGIGKTIIKGNRSMMSNWTTYRSATVAVVGNGFIAKGITFENYAGPGMGQAVALRSGADLSAFYRCSFVGFQDTLYVHSLRQFYRECDVYGTVDFIFGNAAVVIQNSNLYARRPIKNQQNIFTAQARDDPNQNTGISIINCKVAAAADLIPVLPHVKSYLGRPWRNFSRTVFMLSNMMENVVDPKGWLEWDGDFALKTLYYGEYMNRGPGSDTSKRVTWAGFKVIRNATEASQFSVANLIKGNQWLPATGVPFYSNITPS